jgi:hypothetical protein
MTPESEEAIAIVVADFNMQRRLRIKGIAIVPVVWRGFDAAGRMARFAQAVSVLSDRRREP